MLNHLTMSNSVLFSQAVVNLEILPNNKINFETRLLSWKHKSTWGHYHQLGSKHITFESSPGNITWKHH